MSFTFSSNNKRSTSTNLLITRLGPTHSLRLTQTQTLHVNKKVLLRERKRHTARRVASTRCVPGPGGGGVNLSQVRGEYPVPCLGGRGLPHPRSRGVPCPRSRGGTQSQVQEGDTWSQVRGGTHPRSRGVPCPRSLGGVPHPSSRYPPYLDLGWGTSPTWTWDGVPPRT